MAHPLSGGAGAHGNGSGLPGLTGPGPQLALLDFLFPSFSPVSGFVLRYLGIDLNVYIPLLALVAGLMVAWDYVRDYTWNVISNHFMSTAEVGRSLFRSYQDPSGGLANQRPRSAWMMRYTTSSWPGLPPRILLSLLAGSSQTRNWGLEAGFCGLRTMTTATMMTMMERKSTARNPCPTPQPLVPTLSGTKAAFSSSNGLRIKTSGD